MSSSTMATSSPLVDEGGNTVSSETEYRELAKSLGLSDKKVERESLHFPSFVEAKKSVLALARGGGFKPICDSSGTRSKKWVCSKKKDGGGGEHACPFFVRVCRRKDGNVYVTSINLDHSHFRFQGGKQLFSHNNAVNFKWVSIQMRAAVVLSFSSTPVLMPAYIL